jgi:DNA-binding Xre family transcriptional regulator
MARRIIDLTGKQFGRLTAIRRAGKNRHEQVLWQCHCSCGNTLTTLGASLRNGSTRSCGCLGTGRYPYLVASREPQAKLDAMAEHALRTWRQSRNPPLSQSDLARKLGLSRSYVHRVETGARQIGLDLLPLICKRTGLAPEQLRPDLTRLMQLRR